MYYSVQVRHLTSSYVATVMKVVIITVIIWTCHLVAAQEKVCSTVCSTLGMLQSTPGKSCDDIYQFNRASRGVSRNYWINTTTGVHHVYCDMELECGGHKGGWMRIADLDTSRGDDCPSGWTKITTPVATCIAPSNNAGCYSTNFSTLSIPYSKVCGMAVGYQRSYTSGFNFVMLINSPYVDGVSITYGNPRKHIWTYAIGRSDRGNESNVNCPCSEFPGRFPTSFVHENYYCESGTMFEAEGYFVDDPVWDGKNCSDDNNCCSEPSLPWFYYQIPLAASEDIETRICRNRVSDREDVLIRELQLYVQ